MQTTIKFLTSKNYVSHDWKSFDKTINTSFVIWVFIIQTSRIKIDKNKEVKLQKDMFVDFGKIVHYHFNKVTLK
jgi:hypothetical protein